MIELDGSFGEGGGQILRSSLSLSMVTGKAFRLSNIRAGRKNPGLQRQHLTAVRSSAEICGATLRGAALQSSDLTFEPGPVRAGGYRFAIGTAGSTSLVLQTVLPALIMQPEPSTLTLEGGTHNNHSPPYDFLAEAFLPLLNRMGPRVSVQLERPGFYPNGGGLVRVQIQPCERLGRLELRDRGDVKEVRIRAIVSQLPRHIAERETKAVARRLRDYAPAEESIEETRSPGPGNVVLVSVKSPRVTEVFAGFGAKGVPAERVAREAADEAFAYLAAEVPVGPHLADQLLLPLALGEGGTFLTQTPTEHSRTNAEVIRRFLEVPIAFEDLDDRRTIVTVG